MANFDMQVSEFLGAPIVSVRCDAWEGTPIGYFSASGEWTYENEMVPDLEDLGTSEDELRRDALALLAAAAP